MHQPLSTWWDFIRKVMYSLIAAAFAFFLIVGCLVSWWDAGTDTVPLLWNSHCVGETSKVNRQCVWGKLIQPYTLQYVLERLKRTKFLKALLKRMSQCFVHLLFPSSLVSFPAQRIQVAWICTLRYLKIMYYCSGYLLIGVFGGALKMPFL